MAKFFPELLETFLSVESGHAAELKVLIALKKQLVDDEYRVFYRIRQVAGSREHGRFNLETDIMVLHPQLQSLVIEVKGGDIHRDGKTGKWYSADKFNKIHEIKDPLLQVQNNCYALRKELSRVLGPGRIFINWAAIFPDASKPAKDLGTEIKPKTVAFFNHMRFLDTWLKDVLEFWRGDRHLQPLSEEDIEKIIQHISPTIHLKTALGATLQDCEERIVKLTNEQSFLLAGLEGNNRVAIIGGAGTGKTMLALEKARASSAAGRKTLLTCFNRPLAEHLRSVAGTENNLEIFNFHWLCYEKALQTGAPVLPLDTKKTPDDYYQKTLPSLLLDAVHKQPDLKYDTIVVDELQDFTLPHYWSDLQELLKSPDDGEIYVFFDDNQKIYKGEMPELSGFVKFTLTRNMRNTKQIHQVSVPFYSGKELKAAGPDGPDVQYIVLENQSMAGETVVKILEKMISEGKVQPHDIAVLTAMGKGKSSIPNGSKIGRFDISLKPELFEQGKVTFSSIHRFKGLERQAVILCELEDKANRDELLYVGLTRARTYLVVVGAKNTIENIIK